MKKLINRNDIKLINSRNMKRYFSRVEGDKKIENKRERILKSKKI